MNLLKNRGGWPTEMDKNFEEIKGITDLEEASKDAIWQNFEKLVAFIFEENDYEVQINKVKSFSKKRRQYDVIARKNNQVLLVECKKWSGNRYRLSALKAAIKKHKERVNFYESATKEHAIPIIATFIEEDIKLYEGVPIVPILKLNSFIGELDKDLADYSMADE